MMQVCVAVRADCAEILPPKSREKLALSAGELVGPRCGTSGLCLVIVVALVERGALGACWRGPGE